MGDVGKERQVAGHDDAALGAISIGLDTLVAGDPVMHELGGSGVVADNDENRRCAAAAAGPVFEDLAVVAIKRLESAGELGWKLVGGELLALLRPASLRQLHIRMFLDVAINMAIDWFVGARQVLHRDARHFDDAAFDSVDQGEVGNHPGEERTFRVA